MKTQILIMCAVLSFGLGCKKESDQIDRYKVFAASWDETVIITKQDGDLNSGAVNTRKLVKLDSATGRVWCWDYSTFNTNGLGGWTEMTDSGYVFSNAIRTANH
jgi:hypothetical protein